jgi:APA family basic amino acid/polyamine antiporter
MPEISRGHLLRLLGVGFGVAVGFGEVIGSGILRSPSVIAGTVHAFWPIIALWCLGAINALLSANVIVELGTSVPRAGGPYVFAHRAFGDAGGLIVGWTLFSSHSAGSAAASVVFADFLPLAIPATRGHEAAVAVALQGILYATNIAGLREGSVMQGATSLLKALLLFGFVFAASLLVPSHADSAPVALAPIGFAALIGGYQLIKGAYAGWDAAIYFSEESVAPAQSIPRAVFIGIGVTAFLYVAVNAMLLHVLGLAGTAASPLPFATVLARVAGSGASLLFAIGGMIIVIGCANANIMLAPRVLYALARDRLLPGVFESVNAGGSPYVAFLLSAIVSMALASTGAFSLVFGLIAILSTMAGVIVEVSYFVLRRREPDLPRPYRAILYPWLPALALVVDIVLLILIAANDHRGALFAAGMCALCIPLAFLARRVRTEAA